METKEEKNSAHSRWLLLFHTIPPKPNYLRVKVWRRLGGVGAILAKNSVYVLPRSDTSLEAFQWIAKEITQEGGEATICEANFVEGLSDQQLERLFNAERDQEYEKIARAARALKKTLGPKRKVPEEDVRSFGTELAKLRRQFEQTMTHDFFGASHRETVEALLVELDERLHGTNETSLRIKEKVDLAQLQNRIWVTRRGIHVDRMASAWLIRKHIDPKAQFRFVDAKKYEHQAGELRFDMVDAEFTHEGDLCTFEVLVKRLGLKDPGLNCIAEIIHNIDLRDARHDRPEVPGFERLVNGICWLEKEDEARLDRVFSLLDALYISFQRKRGST